MATRTIQSLEALDSFAEEVLSVLPQKDTANIIALSGDLGAGKTTFTQALAKKLGVTEHVVSPTFMIMRAYPVTDNVFTKLVHIDAYRIEDIREMEVLKIPELFTEADTIICIEWPERIEALIPKDAFRIMFTAPNKDVRTITYEAYAG